ncbi:hypothetical protein [Mycobacterium sp.]|jgi:hypothetical protein|uniref:hypothetical protein n=1 Tax=Mycobacterium sp. TaxID=1785 RepID=UPI00333F36AB|nr:hypothetical protein [Mycobacterium sp.]
MADNDRNDTTDTEGQPDDNANEPDDHGPNVTPDNEHDESGEDAETFPRSYVEKLRKENQSYRDRAKDAETRAEDLARQLFRLRVESTGKLADPDDLPYDAELLADDDKLNTAADELIAKRPHYAKRKVAGNVGAGVTGTREEPFSLLGRLKQSV